MLCKESGVLSGSDYFFPLPSILARELLFYVTSCGHFYCDLGYKVAREDYGSYMVFYVKQGRVRMETEGERFTVETGQLCFISCHVHHHYYTEEFTEFIWLHFDGSCAQRFFNHIKKQGLVFPTRDHPSLTHHIERIISAYRNNQPMAETEISSYIYAMLASLLTAEEQALKIRDKGSPVGLGVEFIKENFSSPLSLADVSAHVGMSPFHFSRLFKQATGSSPYEFIVNTRLSSAKHLLKTTDLTIKEIGFAVGYSSESGFTASFSAKVGLAPSKFREFPM